MSSSASTRVVAQSATKPLSGFLESAADDVRHEFPHEVSLTENLWIPMSDGTRLAARLWLPADAENRSVPAVLEYLPYRKNDLVSVRDSEHHGYFAGYGYASIRVDIRGSGDSDGHMTDEYSEQELADGIEVIDWLAAQPWSNGCVGMIGNSYGGFNALQLAALAPEPLKAIISSCASHDRYRDDVHYDGGCLQADHMLSWASWLLAFNARPPDPDVSGPDWRAKWLDRLEQLEPPIHIWLSHQRWDSYWRESSPCDPADYDRFKCAVYMVGGWFDRYTNAILTFLEHYEGPRKGLIGPWVHHYPHRAQPAPRIGFLQEAVRWWDYWLKGIDTGIMDEPMLHAWVLDAYKGAPGHEHLPGCFTVAFEWPSDRSDRKSCAVQIDGSGTMCLRDFTPTVGGAQAEAQIIGSARTGVDAGSAMPVLIPEAQLAGDQRGEDGRSLTFTSEPLVETLSLLGFPRLSLTVSADRPLALVCARLCDVWPTGESTLITRGLLNLTHRDGSETPAPLQPGERYTVTMTLDACGYRVPAGHRLRLSLSPTYWPWAWPSPEVVTLTLHADDGPAGELALPTWHGNAEGATEFGLSEIAQPLETETLEPYVVVQKVERDDVQRLTTITRQSSGRRRILLNRWEHGETFRDTFELRDGDPLSAANESVLHLRDGRGPWQTTVDLISRLTCDRDEFHVATELTCVENDEIVFTRQWKEDIPRDLV